MFHVVIIWFLVPFTGGNKLELTGLDRGIEPREAEEILSSLQCHV